MAIPAEETKLILAGLRKSINCNNVQGEYYLTDVIGILAKNQAKVWAVQADEKGCKLADDVCLKAVILSMFP